MLREPSPNPLPGREGASDRRRVALTLLVLVFAAGCAVDRPVADGSSATEPVYRHAAVASDHPVASEAGLEMLRRGGNAVDAAVATSFTLSVVRPYSCGIGGGGFMVIHIPPAGGEPARQVAINYRERAPAAVGPGYFQALYAREGDDTLSRFGPHAAGVPGTVAGLLYALEHFGTLDKATVLAPAIRAAEGGFAADANFVEMCAELPVIAAGLERWRDAAFLRETLRRHPPVTLGEPVRNRDQARALRLIAEQGAAAFYHGPIGEAIVAVMAAHGGPMTGADLAAYRPDVVAPLRGRFGGHTVVAMPPPSSGGVAMLQMLGLLERHRAVLDGAAHNGADYVHLLAECMKHAFADRAQWLADAAFVDVPVERLLSPVYLDGLASRIDLGATRERFAYGSVEPAPADAGTSHLSVIDAGGMAVACTETINLEFGSLVSVPGFGFALNDEMDDFTTIPGQPNAFGLRQSDRNLPAPGKRPLSSMSPTIVLDGRDRAVLVAGGSGGPRIITGTLQCLLNCMRFDMAPERSVGAARFHHQWMPERLLLEEAWTGASEGDLVRRGHHVGRRDHVGVVQLIRITDDGIRAASDPRKGGRPAGY